MGMKDFTRFYNTNHKRILSRCRQAIRDEGLAEDATQEIMLKIWRNYDAYKARKGSSFHAWVNVVARNTLINWLRDQSRQDRAIPYSDMLDENIPDLSFSPERMLNKLAIMEEVTDALETVDKKLSTPFLMHHRDGMSYPEIAGNLGIPLGTATVRSHRCKLKIRSWISEANDNG